MAALVACALFGAPAASAALPSMRLFASTRNVTVTQNALRFGAADLGLWIASTGGAFQVDLKRPGYGAWNVAQVDSASGARLRSIPLALVDPAAGFRRFLSIRFVDARGNLVAQRLETFCPNGSASRVNDAGPLDSTYLSFCGSQGFGFPFARGEVWGINSDWAVAPPLGPGGAFGSLMGPLPVGPLPPGLVLPRRRWWLSLKPGRYTAIVGITALYRHLFAIPVAQGSVSLGMRVLYSRPPKPRPPARHRHTAGRPAGDAPDQSSIPTLTAPDPGTMPNLVATPAWGIAVRRQHGRDVLMFNATIWDAGPAPFSIEGFRRPGSDLMDAYEYFFDSAGHVVGRAPAGTLEYDTRPGHDHWHLRQLASYSLLGTSRTIQSEKQSFCIAPTDAVDLTLPGAPDAPVAFGGLGFGEGACDLYSPGAIWVREQLAVGWGDTYQQSVAGQAFDITHVPNGHYRIAVRVNPLGELHETSTTDDVAFRQIQLFGRRGTRRVVVAPWHGISG